MCRFRLVALLNKSKKRGDKKNMPFKDPARSREYDKAHKQKQRSEGWTKKGIDNRLTGIEAELWIAKTSDQNLFK
jgi:hypothetical protein